MIIATGVGGSGLAGRGARLSPRAFARSISALALPPAAGKAYPIAAAVGFLLAVLAMVVLVRSVPAPAPKEESRSDRPPRASPDEEDAEGAGPGVTREPCSTVRRGAGWVKADALAIGVVA